MWQWLWDVGILPVGIGFATLAFSIHIARRFKTIHAQRGISTIRGHLWSLHENEHGGRCAVCDLLILPERLWRCEYCGLPVDRRCIRLANRRHRCKTSSSSDSNTEHHWVVGASPDPCCFCIDDNPPTYSCSWCQRTVHKHCRIEKGLETKCDFGPYQQYIVRPGNKSPITNEENITDIKPWMPLLILANSKSGSQDAKQLLTFFRRILNPIQVADLSIQPANKVLESWSRLFPEASSIILAAGGDGTVAWVLSSINELNFKISPSVAIIPLGTGNDLSRALGWGAAWSVPDSVDQMINDLIKSKPIPLDRWRVKIRQRRSLGRRPLEKSLFMYNYLSVGVDALVALEFHRTRQAAWWYIWPSRFVNKFLYLIFGTREAVEPSCKGLERRLALWLDGRPIALPQLQSIVILNISSWGGGVPLWPDSNASPNDMRLEIVGLTSSLHIAQLQVGIGAPIKLGQAKVVKLRILEPSAIQIDGEPWIQTSADLEISFENQASMLQRPQPFTQ